MLSVYKICIKFLPNIEKNPSLKQVSIMAVFWLKQELYTITCHHPDQHLLKFNSSWIHLAWQRGLLNQMFQNSNHHFNQSYQYLYSPFLLSPPCLYSPPPHHHRHYHHLPPPPHLLPHHHHHYYHHHHHYQV